MATVTRSKVVQRPRGSRTEMRLTMKKKKEIEKLVVQFCNHDDEE